MDKLLEKLEHVTPALMQQAHNALQFNYIITMVVCFVLIVFGALAVVRAVRVYKAENLCDVYDLPLVVALPAIVGGAIAAIAVFVFAVSVVDTVKLALWPDVEALQYLLSK